MKQQNSGHLEGISAGSLAINVEQSGTQAIVRLIGRIGERGKNRELPAVHP
ncbi:MAG TPA: hypothetical protein VJT08_14030 [Terriglobales bacterium]|nr:hypothetical protein [Terriglobales bacterium]